MAFWISCETLAPEDNTVQPFCPQSRMDLASIIPLETGVEKTKYAFGLVATVGYLAKVIFLAAVVGVARKMQKKKSPVAEHVELNTLT